MLPCFSEIHSESVWRRGEACKAKPSIMRIWSRPALHCGGILQKVGALEPTADSIVLKLASELASVETVAHTAESFARRAGFDEDTANDIGLVTREAAANAVLHGNLGELSKLVTANFALSEDRLVIQITDEGKGLEPDKIPDPLAPENLLQASGRGVFLMRAMMDEVSFRQLYPGTEITMVKLRKLTKEETAS